MHFGTSFPLIVPSRQPQDHQSSLILAIFVFKGCIRDLVLASPVVVDTEMKGWQGEKTKGNGEWALILGSARGIGYPEHKQFPGQLSLAIIVFASDLPTPAEYPSTIHTRLGEFTSLGLI